jgi:hypothetical protein
MNAPRVELYRYAKGKVVLIAKSDDGWKTRAARLAEAFGGRWVHRAGGYVMSPNRAQRAVDAWHAGLDAWNGVVRIP